jgi:hypothetical protein
MHLDEDADAETITKELVKALRRGAHLVGKIGPSFTTDQLTELNGAARQLQNMIDLKTRMMRDAPRS